MCFERVCGTACVCYLCGDSRVCWQPPRIIVSFVLFFKTYASNGTLLWLISVGEQDVLSGLLGGPWPFLTVL